VGLIVVAALSIGVFSMPTLSSAEELYKAREVVVKGAGVVDLEAIIRTNDNGFIILSPKRAIKTDDDGIIKWGHFLAHGDASVSAIEYSSAAILPNKSIFRPLPPAVPHEAFACGTMIVTNGGPPAESPQARAAGRDCRALHQATPGVGIAVHVDDRFQGHSP
jgi:hypothetical protein